MAPGFLKIFQAVKIYALLGFLICQQSIALTTEEKQALNVIKSDWNVQNWPGDPDCARWNLTCDSDGHLVELSFGMNYKGEKLTGAIPQEICKLGYLQNIGIYAQRISGTIPDCIGDLNQLKRLSLAENCLGGPIPESLGRLKQIEHLDLSMNHNNIILKFPEPDQCANVTVTPKDGLTGLIPDSIGQMTALQYIDLSNNLLKGPIPESIGNLSSMVYIAINNNKLHGTQIPESIGKLINLQSILLNSNGLCGTIPKSVGNLVNLQTMAMSDNKLTGPIPEFRKDAHLILNLIDLQNNSLNGSLPISMEQAPLRYLLVNNNKQMKSGKCCHLPEYIKIDWKRSSIIDENLNYECPGLTMDPKFFHMKRSTVVQIDPEYYSYSHCYCRPGFFGNPPNDCQKCLANGYCPPTQWIGEIGKMPYGAGCMAFDTGYFPVQAAANGSNKIVTALEACDWQTESSSACNPNGDCGFCKTNLTKVSNPNQPCKVCQEGYEGRKCSKCSCSSSKGSACYFQSQNKCIKCSNISKVALILAFYAYLSVLVIYAWFYYSFLIKLLLIIAIVTLLIALESSSWLDLDIFIACIILIPATNNGLGSGLVRAFILYLQTAASIGQRMLPQRLSYLFNQLQFINLRFMGIVCFFPGLLGESENALLYHYIMSLSAPFAILLGIILFLALKGFVNQEGIQEIIKEWLYSIIFITYFAFFKTAQLVILAFNCQKDSLGQDWMSAHPYVECGSSLWYKLVIAAIISAVLFIAMPFVVFIALLCKNRKRLNDNEIKPWLGTLYLSYQPKTDNDVLMLRKTNTRPMPNSLFHRALYRAFPKLYRTFVKLWRAFNKQQVWMFSEVLFMVLRLALAACIALPPLDNIWRPVGIGIVLSILGIVFILYQPYTHLRENVMGFLSVVCLTITLICSEQLKRTKTKYDSGFINMGYVATLEWFTFLFNVLLFAIFVALILWSGRKNLRKNWKEFKDMWSSVKNKIRNCCYENDIAYVQLNNHQVIPANECQQFTFYF